MTALKLLFVWGSIGLIAGCATPQPTHYYTLLPSFVASAAPTPAKNRVAPYAISVQTVQLPEQVDKPQIVITDPASTQVMPLNSSLWASPLSDEIRGALSDDLSRRLGVLDVSATGAPESLPIWKIALRVQRFESLYNQRAVLDATWLLTPVNQNGKATRLCRAQVQVPVGEGMSAMVAGHQQALQLLAGLMAEQLETGRPVATSPEIQLKGCN